ncbi:MAG TPA: hypothetical protein VGE97_09205 [Nitrososphaera sp.]|jgi:hypothetical protein
MFRILMLDHPDWTIPWAGLGALLLGLGSALSGVAAIITARNRGRDETVPTADSQSDTDGGSGVSSSDSIESE